MSAEISEIVASFLGKPTDVFGVGELVDQRLAAGDAAFVADLGIALSQAYESTIDPPLLYRSVSDHILRLLAIAADPPDLQQVVRLCAARGVSDLNSCRLAASLLASSRPAADLEAIFVGDDASGPEVLELRACLVHELVVRGVDIGDFPQMGSWAASPCWAGHPLRWLPLHRSTVEIEASFPTHSVTHWAGPGMPFGPYDGPAPPAVSEGGGVPTWAETTTPAAAAAIASAVMIWNPAVMISNPDGGVEARTFALGTSVSSVADLLPELGLACLPNRPRLQSFATGRPAEIWGILFAAASGGGAGGDGVYGAYGRLAAWQSMAGLSGVTGPTPFADVECRSLKHRWFTFGAATEWFCQVAWDIGIAALSGDGRSLAVLAATTSD